MKPCYKHPIHWNTYGRPGAPGLPFYKGGNAIDVLTRHRPSLLDPYVTDDAAVVPYTTIFPFRGGCPRELDERLCR